MTPRAQQLLPLLTLICFVAPPPVDDSDQFSDFLCGKQRAKIVFLYVQSNQIRRGCVCVYVYMYVCVREPINLATSVLRHHYTMMDAKQKCVFLG